MGTGAQILYLLLTALFMLFVTARRTRNQTIRWKVSAAVIWMAIFVGLAIVADRLGLHTPNP